jgi:hypothetical protein
MNPSKINSNVTAGNFELEKVLKEIVQSFNPSFIPGNIYVVFNSSDTAYVQYAKDWNHRYPDGTEVVHTSLLSAYNAASSNRHDVILINGHNTHTLTAMLTVSKSRLHFYGMDAPGRRYGQGAKVSLGVTTAATDIATIKNTGVRNSFHHIKFLNSNTVTEGIYCFADAGEYTFMEFCELYKSTDLDQTGAAELVANGDSSHYKDCYIGTTVDAISGAILRPCVTFSRGLANTGAVARDVTFENCIFARKCGDTGNRFVYGAEANAVERLCLFENCIFWNAALASATPAQNVAFGATQTDGSVLLHNCSSIGAATAMSTTTGVFVDSPVPAAATSGIALQAS